MAKNRQQSALALAIAALDANQSPHRQLEAEACDLAIPVLFELSSEGYESDLNGDGKKPMAIRIDDGLHDAAKTLQPMQDFQADEAEADEAEPVEEKAPSPASPTSFVGRLMRGVSLKRELNAQIARLQQEMKQRQQLVEKYQEEVIAPAKQVLERDALELRHVHASLVDEMKATLVRMAEEGESRERIDRYRSLQLLKLQRNRILQSRVELHQNILQTRCEECDWMSMAIGSAYQQEISTLLTPSSSVAALQQAQADESERKAIAKVAIEADDPFFASAETLFQTHSESKQLQLQLDSVEQLIEKTQARFENSEQQSLAVLSPTQTPRSIQKQSSSQRAHTMQGILASVVSASRRALTMAVGSRRVHGCRRPRSHAFQDALNAFQRLASDKRTRTGRLMAAFGRKLAEDARSHVQLSIEQRVGDTAEFGESGGSSSDFYLPSADFVLLQAANSPCADIGKRVLDIVLDQLGDAFVSPTDAVNLKMLPPPVSIVAFARFMKKTIVAEYALDQFQNETTPPKIGTEKLKPIDVKTQKAALEACVHYFVFSQLANIGFAYAFSGYLTMDVNRKIDEVGVVTPLLQTWHWKHSKRAIQHIPLAQLAFPSGALKRVESAVRSPQDESNGLLQQSLQAFCAIESETTPLGVVNRVMGAFKVLHEELFDLLQMPNRQQNNQSAGSFLNADVLIPSLVLMMSRLEHESDLDHLWRQVSLVKAFQRPLLIEDGEEAYYLTCLLAAMEFVQTYNPDPSLQQPLSIARKECSECCALAARLKVSGSKSKASKASTALPALMSDEEAVRQLSAWISGHASVESASCRSGSEFERWVYTAR